MPVQKDLKRLVRARMRKTGESYTAARAKILAKRPPEKRPARATAPAPAAVASGGAGMSDEAVARRTEKTWAEWAALLDRAGAARMPHREIAALLAREHGLSSWWAQTVTVGYERLRGRRVPGQRHDGKFAASRSKTFPVPLETLWRAFGRCGEWLGEDRAKLRMSKATRLRTMRMTWEDGTPVVATFVAKGEAKSQLGLAHGGLATHADAVRLRAFWGERIAALAARLDTAR